MKNLRLAVVLLALAVVSAGCSAPKDITTQNDIVNEQIDFEPVKQLTYADLSEYLLEDNDLFDVYNLPIEWADTLCVINNGDYTMSGLRLQEGSTVRQTFDCMTFTEVAKVTELQGSEVMVGFEKACLREQLSEVPITITGSKQGEDSIIVTLKTKDYDCQFNYGDFVFLVEKYDSRVNDTYYSVQSWQSPFVSGTEFDVAFDYVQGERITGILPMCRAGFAYTQITEMSPDYIDSWMTASCVDSEKFYNIEEPGTEIVEEAVAIDYSPAYVTIKNKHLKANPPFNRYQIELTTADATFYVPVGKYMHWAGFCEDYCTFKLDVDTPLIDTQSIRATMYNTNDVPILVLPQRVENKYWVDIYYAGENMTLLNPTLLINGVEVEYERQVEPWEMTNIPEFVTAYYKTYLWNSADIPDSPVKMLINGIEYTLMPLSDIVYPQDYVTKTMAF